MHLLKYPYLSLSLGLIQTNHGQTWEKGGLNPFKGFANINRKHSQQILKICFVGGGLQ